MSDEILEKQCDMCEKKQSIDKFSWGVSDRGSSIRVPLATSKEWKGYVEDRRPASNADPYRIVAVIEQSLRLANAI